MIVSCNDGTGTGKSFGQLKAYIKETEINETACGHRCLFFITPLKNQIDFSDKLVQEGLSKGIYFVPFLFRQDLYSMSFSNWLPDINDKIETNKERYVRWIKARHPLRSKSEEIHNALVALDSAIRALEAAEFKIKDTTLTEGMRASLEDTLTYERSGIVSTLSHLAIICTDATKKTLKGLLDSSDWMERLLAEIILHSFPLEIAKFRPCIFISTTRKFDFNATILRQKDNGTHYRVNMPFTRLLGGKKHVGIPPKRLHCHIIQTRNGKMLFTFCRFEQFTIFANSCSLKPVVSRINVVSRPAESIFFAIFNGVS